MQAQSVSSQFAALKLPASNKVTFTLTPKGNQTTVTWAMQGTSPFVAKLMGTVMNMDKMVGGQFEEGLAKLKTLSETAAKK